MTLDRRDINEVHQIKKRPPLPQHLNTRSHKSHTFTDG